MIEDKLAGQLSQAALWKAKCDGARIGKAASSSSASDPDRPNYGASGAKLEDAHCLGIEKRLALCIVLGCTGSGTGLAAQSPTI